MCSYKIVILLKLANLREQGTKFKLTLTHSHLFRCKSIALGDAANHTAGTAVCSESCDGRLRQLQQCDWLVQFYGPNCDDEVF